MIVAGILGVDRLLKQAAGFFLLALSAFFLGLPPCQLHRSLVLNHAALDHALSFPERSQHRLLTVNDGLMCVLGGILGLCPVVLDLLCTGLDLDQEAACRLIVLLVLNAQAPGFSYR